MPKTLPLIDASILKPVVSWLDQNGAITERYLDLNHIPGEVIESGGWISKRQVYSFLADVVHRERCDEIGFAAFMDFQLDDLGSMGHAIRTTGTVSDALGTFSRLAARAFEGNQFWIEHNGNEAWLCNRILDDVPSEGRAIGQHASVMILAGLLRSVADKKYRPQRIRLQAKQARSLNKVQGFEDCQAAFECTENAIAFPAKFLSRKTIGSWRSKVQQASHEEVDQSTSFVRSLHRLIESRFGYSHPPSLELASEITGVNVRTLKRRLFDGGTTYRELLDRIRFDRASEMLLGSCTSVSEISVELGYSAPANFVRAFKRMSGYTPSEFRSDQEIE
ncbi:CFA/I fimbrial subunit D [Symmachiella macrocystis]|uniref:CFA/I fimbrial subunit D n=2 Tax=Symmachiella macrocystis TaxID=2527985 RepID=A0A5C6ASQ7_9PLAN|nr:CFA/I fimbrial subunit D [Symmachiella macrocystis]